MTRQQTCSSFTPKASAAALALFASLGLLGSCGGGGDGSNPFDNAATIANPAGTTNGQKLSFAYFQRCVQPILEAQLPNLSGTGPANSCAAAGCHDNTNGTGGALRLVGGAAPVTLSQPGLTADAIRVTAMYRNFYSAQGETLIGSPTASRILNKPLVRGVLHGGGLIFADDNVANARIIRYWITRPMPAGQDEFSPAAQNLFTPPDVDTGACNSD